MAMKHLKDVKVVSAEYCGKSKKGYETFCVTIKNGTERIVSNVRVPVRLTNRILFLKKDEVLRTLKIEKELSPGETSHFRFYVDPSDGVYKVDIFPVKNGNASSGHRPIVIFERKWRKGWTSALSPSPA